MPEFIANTSPLQYLHQLGLLDLLPKLTKGEVIVPPAVERELAEGRSSGWSLPDLKSFSWIRLRQPVSAQALPLASHLGPGEASVLALALEASAPVVIMDDALGRRVAERLNIRLTGTMGLLLDAKSARLIPAVKPHLDKLTQLRFRVSEATRRAVLRLAGEAD